MKGLAPALAVAAVLAASPLQRFASPANAAAPVLDDLLSVDDLQSAFNRDAGKVRLVLLLSPT
jgi:hypothetical protein